MLIDLSYPLAVTDKVRLLILDDQYILGFRKKLPNVHCAQQITQ